jgi:hypothetical protein
MSAKKNVVENSVLGRYETVELALDWISMVRNSEDYRKLSQTELINKALEDVRNNVATFERIEELRQKIKKKTEEKTAMSEAK